MRAELEPFTVAVVQESPVYLNLEQSLEKACALIEKAGGQQAKLIAFPETWLPGYPIWLDVAPEAALWDHPPAKAVFARLFTNSVAIPGPIVERLGNAAKSAGSVVLMGVHEIDGGTLYNSILYIGADGRLLGKHRKLMPTYTERLVWGQGDGSTLTTVDTPLGRVGGLICWEHWMPLARAAMHHQGELVHVAQWPTAKEMHQVASRHYAFEGQCFVMVAGAILTKQDLLDTGLSLFEQIPGDPDELLMRGGSAIIAPNGDYLAGPLYDQAGIVTAEIQPYLPIEGKMTLDVSGHYARPDVFQLQVNRAPLVNVSFVDR